ncbi:MAG: hypothetical protein IPK66_15660 [Rhodospirillales bacterium]|nr:hypothetical protein [Rhodospirillales bacterium]
MIYSVPLGKAGDDAPQPSAADVRGQLERILASNSFAASSKCKALFRFLVEETLAGRGDRLKGFTVAVAVFGRDETFDSQTDPVVRLEARRLRRGLDGYYANDGTRDPVRISIPKGAYVPLFGWQDGGDVNGPSAQSPVAPEVVPEPTTDTGLDRAARRSDRARRHILVFGLAAIVLLIAAGGGRWLWTRHLLESAGPATPEPQEHGATIIVLPFEALSDGNEDKYLAAGLSQQLIADLMRFDAFRLYSAAASFRQGAEADTVDLGRSLAVAFVVKGSVRSGGGVVRIGVQLVEATSGRMLWSETFDRKLTPDNLLDVQEDLAKQLAMRLAQPYGVINDAAVAQLHRNPPQSMFAYGCVLRAYTYRATFSRDMYPGARACLEEAVQLDPAYAEAFALLGWLHLDAARYRFVPEADAAAELNEARVFAERAVALAPKQPLSLQAMAAVSFYRGEFDKAEELQREVLALNPNDPEASAQLGWRLAFRGRWDEGLGYLRWAIERCPSPPAWYYTSLAMHAYLQGDYAQALVEAEKAQTTVSGIGLALYAMTQAALGDQAEAKTALDELALRVPYFASDPAAALRIHHIDEPIIERLLDGMRGAGWKKPDTSVSVGGAG